MKRVLFSTFTLIFVSLVFGVNATIVSANCSPQWLQPGHLCSAAEPIICATGIGQYCCPTFAECTVIQEQIGNGADSDANIQNAAGAGIDGIDNEEFNAFNPLRIAQSPLLAEFSTPGGIISRALLFLFPLAGLILFVMIFWGGFEMLGSSATKKSIDAGKQRITAAIVGFALLFVSYWLIRLLEEVLGIKVF